MDGQEGDACMIDDKTRGSLNLAGELLGVDADALEKAMVSKTMAVSDQEQKYWYSKKYFRFWRSEEARLIFSRRGLQRPR